MLKNIWEIENNPVFNKNSSKDNIKKEEMYQESL
jgi:hypothetical protein